jgi:hypothetical protein
VPAGLPVALHGFDGQSLLGTYTTTAGAGGGFQFSGVKFTPSRQFIATTDYQSVTYASQVGTFDVAQGTLSLTLPIYETTSDAGVLAVDQMHTFLEFNSPSQVTVGQLLVFSNSGDRTYAANSGNPLSFNLPAGATNLNVQGAQINQTFFRNGNDFTLLWSIPPGQSSAQVLYSFELPYNNQLDYQQKMTYPVSNMDVLVSDLGVQLSGSQLQNQGLQNFQGQTFQNYAGGAVGAGQTIQMRVSGAAGTGATAPAGILNTPTGTLSIGLGGLALALAGIGLYVYRRPRAQAQAAANRDDLLEAIAELDDTHAAGEMGEAEYQKERGELKEQLKRVWKSE